MERNLSGNQVVGLEVGGNFTATGTKYATTYSSVGSYTLGNVGQLSNDPTAPLLVGGVEAIGVNGTGTFTQNLSGTNAIVGGGNYGTQKGGAKQGNSNTPFCNSVGVLAIGFWNGGAFARSGPVLPSLVLVLGLTPSPAVFYRRHGHQYICKPHRRH